MPAPSPIITEAATNGGLVKGTLLAALVERVPFVLKSSETLAGTLSQSAGLIYNVIHSMTTGFAYYYDASDTTTPDDGITCLVDADGHRYLVADGSDLNISTVLALQNDPPGSPVVGDSYIVGTSPTGAWAAHADDVALWTLRGWVFAQPGVGQTVYNQATDGNLQYDESGDWVGFAISFSTGSIPNSALGSMFGISVEAQQNAPPGSPTTGQYYLVGASGSGAWSGHSNDVAYWNGTAWEFFDPYDGAAVYNKATDLNLNWNGTAWTGIGSSQVQEFSTPGSFTWTKPPVGTMALIQAWGAGGSGGKSTSQSNGADGGGGGAYVEVTLLLASLPSSVTVTVGAGGAAVSVAGNGNNGANTTFGSILTAYGGDGGNGGSAVGGMFGGAGGGVTSRGASGTGGGPSGGAVGSNSVGGDSLLGGGGGGLASSTAGRAGGNSIDGGGGGGANGNGGSGNPAAGGNSFRGGGGGGSRGWAMAGGAGGVSQFGGNGGAGATGGGNGTAGAQPGGGGGGAESGNSGKGGDGRVRVTVF